MPYPDDLTGFDLGYLVGLFEGEGCVFFYKHIRSRKGHPVSFRAGVFIGNTYRPMLEKVQSITGIGHIGNSSRKPIPGRRKQYYEWRVTAQKEALWFLENIFPYLAEKKDKAREVMMFLGSRIALDAQKQNPKLRGYSEYEWNCYNHFKNLSRKRGINAIS